MWDNVNAGAGHPDMGVTRQPLDGLGESGGPRPALFVGHPGHELCVHAWLGRTRPHVFVLTDGGGRAGRPRLDFTRRVLAACGAAPCEPFGRFPDTTLYDALLYGRSEPLLALIDELAEALLRLGVSCLVADPADGFNPGHDVCRALAGAALERVRRMAGSAPPGYEYLLVTRPGDPWGEGPPGWPRLTLSAAEFQAKLRAARGYTPLRAEIDAALRLSGAALFRTERFRPMTAALPWRAAGDPPPVYEGFGEQQVSSGRYPQVVRYGRHMRPLLGRVRRHLEGVVRCAA
jgi:hypothetical protein